MLGSGYDVSKIHLIKGLMQQTLPELAPQQIALERHDTDFYESTRHELEHLYPRLSHGGVIIFDDYGHWLGHRQAVDEYVEQNRIPMLLNRVNYSCRIAVKP